MTAADAVTEERPDRNLALELVRVTEAAALAAGRWVGRGDKIAADQKYANEVLKVNSTPTFFINGEKVTGETSFEEFEKKIEPLLKS